MKIDPVKVAADNGWTLERVGSRWKASLGNHITYSPSPSRALANELLRSRRVTSVSVGGKTLSKDKAVDALLGRTVEDSKPVVTLDRDTPPVVGSGGEPPAEADEPMPAPKNVWGGRSS